PRRPGGPRQWNRTTLGRLVVPPIAPAILPREGPLRRESNAEQRPSEGRVGVRPNGETMESPRGVAPRHAGLQSAPTAGSRARVVRAAGVAPALHGLEDQPTTTVFHSRIVRASSRR